MLWSTLFCGVFFKVLNSIGRFRVSHVYEVIGIDLLMHASIHDLSISKFLAEQKDKKTDILVKDEGFIDLS